MSVEKIPYEILGKKFINEINFYNMNYHSLMSNVQKQFIMSFITENKINNALEVGVFNGVSSLCMLKAGLSVNENFNLYAIDYSKNEQFIGQAVRELCDDEEKKHYHLNIGKTTADINNIIDTNIKFDFVFIDGGHAHPEPLFDLIYIIPYIHDETIILLHDIVDYLRPNAWGPSFIFETWTGEKYRVYDYDNNIFSSMGYIKLHKNKNELLENILSICGIPFRASPRAMLLYNVYDTSIIERSNTGLSFSMNEINKLSNYVEKYYSKTFAQKVNSILSKNYEDYIKVCVLYMQETKFFNYLHRCNIKNENSINNLINEFNRISELRNEISGNWIKLFGIYNTKNYLIFYLFGIKISIKMNEEKVDKLAWFIPVKKWRENFRNKFFDNFIGGGVNNGFKFLYPLNFRLDLNY